MKDSIDFAREDISILFKKLLYPTLLGMLFTALFIITDGVFVGRGLGSDALAAVNITAPLFILMTGLGLMFGGGASVVASIHMSEGKLKVARINVTQATIISLSISAIISIFVLIYPDFTLRLLGCSEKLLPLSRDYIYGFAPFFIFNILLTIGGFFLRLSGAPNYAMVCAGVAAIINVVLDYLFIFVFKWGMFGAAFATGVGTALGAIMMLIYLFNHKNTLHFIRIKLSKNSFLLTSRNVAYMCKIGCPSLMFELSIALMIVCGNYVFLDCLSEDGVAAFSIICYTFPIIFMIYNSISQSAQPIISYNYGASSSERVEQAFRIALKTVIITGVVLFIIMTIFRSDIVSLFIDPSLPAHNMAVVGLPLFALSYIPFGINLVFVAYFQSVKRTKLAGFITFLKGFVLLVFCFYALPAMFGSTGAWLALPCAEVLALIYILIVYFKTRTHSIK